jgi:hypothetical protein
MGNEIVNRLHDGSVGTIKVSNFENADGVTCLDIRYSILPFFIRKSKYREY